MTTKRPSVPSDDGVTGSAVAQWRLRLLTAIEERSRVLVVVLLVLAVVGVWGVYATHLSPQTHAQEQVVSAWSETGEFEHAATVVNGSGPFEHGAELTDQPVYFVRATPTVDGAFEYRYNAANGSIDARTDVELVVRAVDDEADNTETKTVYWQTTETLNESRSTGLEPGDRHRVTFTVDLVETTDRIEEVEDHLDASPGRTEVLVRANTTLEGIVDGEPVEERTERVVQFEPSETQYRVENVSPRKNRYREIERQAIAIDHGPIRSIGSIVLLIASVIGLVATVGADRIGTSVSEEERTRFEHARERDAFDEWITRGALPPSLRDRHQIDVASLEGLVDLAIDSDRRVIEDQERDVYYVLDSEAVYTYEPP